MGQIKRVEAKQALPDDKITIRLNYLMAVFLIFGIVLQIIFITVNTDYMAKQNLGIKGNTPTPTSKIQDKALPHATAPTQLQPIHTVPTAQADTTTTPKK